jgi:hypothetical protein
MPPLETPVPPIALSAPPSTKAELQEALAAAKAQVAELSQAKAVNAELEKKVSEKIGLGLKRDQALAAVRRQDAFDQSDYGRETAQRHAERQTKALAAKTKSA